MQMHLRTVLRDQAWEDFGMLLRLLGIHKVRFGAIGLSAIAAFALALSPTQALADEITLAGTASGSFSGSGTNVLNGMTFTAGPFGGITSGGFAALNLGSFYLSPTTNSGYSGNFALDVTFTQPTGIVGNNSTDYTAQVLGNVSQGTGGVWVFNFFPGSYTFSFSGPETGSFSLSVNSVSVAPGATDLLTGFVVGGTASSTSVPEPSTILLAGIGIAGIFLLKRRLLLA
jgi:hypothetical protein